MVYRLIYGHLRFFNRPININFLSKVNTFQKFSYFCAIFEDRGLWYRKSVLLQSLLEKGNC